MNQRLECPFCEAEAPEPEPMVDDVEYELKLHTS